LPGCETDNRVDGEIDIPVPAVRFANKEIASHEKQGKSMYQLVDDLWAGRVRTAEYVLDVSFINAEIVSDVLCNRLLAALLMVQALHEHELMWVKCRVYDPPESAWPEPRKANARVSKALLSRRQNLSTGSPFRSMRKAMGKISIGPRKRKALHSERWLSTSLSDLRIDAAPGSEASYVQRDGNRSFVPGLSRTIDSDVDSCSCVSSSYTATSQAFDIEEALRPIHLNDLLQRSFNAVYLHCVQNPSHSQNTSKPRKLFKL